MLVERSETGTFRRAWGANGSSDDAHFRHGSLTFDILLNEQIKKIAFAQTNILAFRRLRRAQNASRAFEV
jgi:hypothetical protein